VNAIRNGEGRMIRIRMADAKEVQGLMATPAYRKYVEDEAN
jgi:hypothetical protein